MNRKAPLIIFVTTFMTFMVAFAALLVLAKPELFGLQKLVDRAGFGSAGALAEDPGQANADLGSLMNSGRDRASGRDPETGEAAVLSGRVRDASGKPVAGAIVSVLEDGPGTAGEEGLRSHARIETGPDGRFRSPIPALRRNLRIVVCAEGFARWQAIRPADRKGPSLPLGEIELEPGVEIQVNVWDPEEQPIGDAKVTIRDPGEDLPEELRRRDLEGVSTAQGEACMVGADFGLYEFEVTKPGYLPHHGVAKLSVPGVDGAFHYTATLVEASSFVTGSVTDKLGRPVDSGNVVARSLQQGILENFELRAPITRDGSFRLGPLPRGDYELELDSPGLMQSSRVYAEADGDAVRIRAQHAGVVRGSIENQGELVNPSLLLMRRDDRGALLPFHGARGRIEAADRTFVANGVPPGRYLVRLAADGLAPGRSEEFAVEAGETVEGIRISLTAGGGVLGKLLDVRGAALPRVRVTAFEGLSAPPPALASLFGDTARRSAETTASGEFELSGLSPGPQVLVFEARGMPARIVGPLEIPDTGELRIGSVIMGGGGSLSGTVLGVDGSPVSSARVLMKSPADEIWFVLRTDAVGAFTVRGLPKGDFELCPVSRSKEGNIRRLGSTAAVSLGVDEHLRQDLQLK